MTISSLIWSVASPRVSSRAHYILALILIEKGKVMKRYPLAIMLVLLLWVGVAQAAKPLPYGERPVVGREYVVNATTFGSTSWDDNGIGYFGGVDLFRLKWGVAELDMHSAMGGLPGGTRILVRYGKRSVITVLADIGGACCYYHIDLHIGVARYLGLAQRGGVGKVRITVLPGRPNRLTTAGMSRGIGPVDPGYRPGKPLPSVRRHCEGARFNISHAGFGCTSVRSDRSSRHQ